MGCLAAMAVTAGPAQAASSGSLTGVLVGASTGYAAPVSMTGAVGYDCAGQGYCGWFPEVYTVDAGQPCSTAHLVWVGTLTTAPSATFGPSYTAFTSVAKSETACLYIYAGGEVNVAQASYDVPGAPAPASPAPTTPVTTPPTSTTGPATDVTPLSIADARANLTGILRTKFAGHFANHRSFKRDCYRLTTQKVRCRVRWNHGQWRYAGAVDMRNDPEDPENTILYTNTIRRKRLHAAPSKRPPSTPAPTAPTPTSPTPSQTSPTCDPSYSGKCLKPNVSDYDCAGGSGDGPYYVQGPVTVVGDDHYGLDRDGDGIACES